MSVWADGVWGSEVWRDDVWDGMGGVGSGGDTIPIPPSVRLDSCSIVHTLHTDDATFTVSSAVASMPASNLQTPNRDEVWRSTSIAATTINFTFDDNRARGFGFWGIFNHQLFGCQVQFQLFQDANFAGVLYDSTALDVGTSVTVDQRFGMIQDSARDLDLTYFAQPMWRFFLPMVYARSGQLTITGTPFDEDGNSLSYYQIARLVAGPFYQFGRGVDFAPALSVPSNTRRSRSGGGSNRRNKGAQWKKLVCNMRVTATQDYIALEQIMEHMGTGRDGVLSIHTGRTGFTARTWLLNGCFSSEDALTKDFSISGKQLVFESN